MHRSEDSASDQSCNDNEANSVSSFESDDIILSDIHVKAENGKPDGKEREIVIELENLNNKDLDIDAPFSFKMNFNMGTELDLVGKQLWAGALLLADYMLNNNELFKNQIIVELGSGIGLVGIIASYLKAKTIYCTDYEDSILDICYANIKNSVDTNNFKAVIKKIDWIEFSCPQQKSKKAKKEVGDYFWSREDIISCCQSTSVFLAADVIYDDDITDAFISTVHIMLKSSKHSDPVLFLALEKRINFSLEELRVAAKAYDYMHSLLESQSFSKDLMKERITVDFPQIIKSYERTAQLEIWKISLKRST